MPEPAGPWHETVHRLRFSDNDSVGHVNNAVYAVMFEAGRTELMEAAGLFERSGPLSAVIVRLEIDFKREMSWPGEVAISSAVSRLGAKSFDIRQRIAKSGLVTAEGISVIALIDRETRRAVPLDPGARTRLAPWTLPGA